MRLPAGRIQQFLGGGAAGAPQQFEDLRRFAAAPGTRLGGLGFRAARGAFFAAVAFLPGFGFGVATWGRGAPTRGFVVGFVSAVAVVGVTGCSVVDVI